jgi:hypothetical protein
MRLAGMVDGILVEEEATVAFCKARCVAGRG